MGDDNDDQQHRIMTTLKIEYKREIHRAQMDISEYHFADLTQWFKSTFELTFPDDYVIQYYDNTSQKNRHVVKDEASFQAACALHAKTLVDDHACLRFVAQTKASAAMYDATEPIFKAIEKLLQQLNHVIQQVTQRAKTDDWEGKCRQRFNRAGDVIQRVAQGTKTSLQECHTKVRAFPYHDVLRDTSEGLKMAAQEMSSLAHDLARQVSLEFKDSTTTTTTTTTMNEEDDQDHHDDDDNENDDEAPVIVASVQAEDDWAVVANEPEMSAAEKYWEVQLQMVKNVFPDCDHATVIALLESHTGDVNLVLNQMAEQ